MNQTKNTWTSLLSACSAAWLIFLLLVITVSNYLIYAVDQAGADKPLASVTCPEQQDGSSTAGSSFPASGPDEKASSGPVSFAEEYTHEKDTHYPCRDKWKLPFGEGPHRPLLKGPNSDLERPPCC